MLRVLRVSPAPLGDTRRAALTELFGDDVEVVSTPASTLEDVAVAADGVDAVVLDCVRGLDPDVVRAATGLPTLRPVRVEVKDRRGMSEARFSHYDICGQLNVTSGVAAAAAADRHLTRTG